MVYLGWQEMDGPGPKGPSTVADGARLDPGPVGAGPREHGEEHAVAADAARIRMAVSQCRAMTVSGWRVGAVDARMGLKSFMGLAP
jgi:hypothetical protein